MSIDSVSFPPTSASIAIAVQQLKVVSEAQMEVLQALSESQAQMSQMLQSEGIGLNINISA
jgi:hypothetical protein